MNVYKLKDGTECFIRRATLRDAAEIVRYSNVVGGESDFLSYGNNEFSYTIEQERQVIKDYTEVKNRLFLVAVIDGSICGTLTFWGNNRKRLEHWGEFGVSVIKKYWGKGIGTTLLDTLIKWAEAGKIIKKVDLMVREDNYPAIALYKKMGFQIEGRIRRAMIIGGKYYDFLYMGRLVD
ncbi:putative ribosomal N-acetyltransferase YdaF [Oxobacter pfennigii]|uniref:Putative ribosomal N-acetyltransferase YdaF n=1 Tax=Oxobacter pfennigii TaxID=36849 RepID=A0A0P8W5X9_9CLOT|nr:GNAT family N-acetyltransferase [Oxobacter pfennigii]KPU43099.1 putative ribosomal N-acetyltransferase YdaF [Oxobacter pfennigii]